MNPEEEWRTQSTGGVRATFDAFPKRFGKRISCDDERENEERDEMNCVSGHQANLSVAIVNMPVFIAKIPKYALCRMWHFIRMNVFGACAKRIFTAGSASGACTGNPDGR